MKSGNELWMNKVLLIHDRNSSFDEFEDIIPVFIKMQYHVFAFNYFEKQNDNIEDLNEYEQVINDEELIEFIKLFIDHHNLTNLVVLGNGKGAKVALECAEKY